MSRRMTPEIRHLLSALVDIGSGDIYTDAWEYAGRVSAMQGLIVLADRALSAETVRVEDIDRALAMRETDAAPEDLWPGNPS